MMKYRRVLCALLSGLLLAGALCSCGKKPFRYDLDDYAVFADHRALTLESAVIEERLQSDVQSLLDNYKDVCEKTSGELQEGDEVRLFFEGTVILFDGDCLFAVGSGMAPELDEELTAHGLVGGRLTVECGSVGEWKLSELTGGAVFGLPADVGVKAELTCDRADGPVKEGESLSCKLKLTCDFGEVTGIIGSNRASGDAGYALTLGSGVMPGNFEDELIGSPASAGSKKGFEIVLPDPFAKAPDVAGKTVHFVTEIVSAHRFIERDLENPDDFALLRAEYEADYGAGSFDYADAAAYLADMRASVKGAYAVEQLAAACRVGQWNEEELDTYTARLRNYYVNMFSSYLGAYSSGDFDEIEQAVAAYLFGVEFEDYLQIVLEQSREQLRRDWTVWHIAECEKLDRVKRNEYKAFIAQQIDEYNRYFEVHPDADGSVTVYTDKEIVETVYGGKDEVVKAIVGARVEKWLAENVAEN